MVTGSIEKNKFKNPFIDFREFRDDKYLCVPVFYPGAERM